MSPDTVALGRPAVAGFVERRSSSPAALDEATRSHIIDGVEQLTRFLKLMNRDTALRPVKGIFAAQEIKPQARTLAQDRGIECVLLDYDALRGTEDPSLKLF